MRLPPAVHRNEFFASGRRIEAQISPSNNENSEGPQELSRT